MESKFTSEFFAGNRQRLRELFTGTAPIIVTANGLLQRGSDSTYGFSQDANFWYLTGLNEPDIILVMDKNKDYLIVPERSASRQAFDGEVTHQPLTKRSGIDTVYEGKEGWEILEKRLKKSRHAATVAVPPAYIEHYGMYTNPARAALVEKIKAANSELEMLDLNQHLIRLRMVKQPQEIAALQAAIDITIASFKAATRPANLKKLSQEYELEAEISRGFRQRGAIGHAFEPIVAGGERACVLHNVSNAGRLSADELVIIDIGAEVEHYAADITRTINLGAASARQIALHGAVAEVQQFAFSLLKPGLLLKDYEEKIEDFMGEKLRALGLIKTITHDEVRKYYPHATTHFLGLNVHDVGDYSRPLEPGMVMTVEPGIYIPAEGIGVRIEDDVLITSKGIKILSGKLPRDLK